MNDSPLLQHITIEDLPADLAEVAMFLNDRLGMSTGLYVARLLIEQFPGWSIYIPAGKSLPTLVDRYIAAVVETDISVTRKVKRISSVTGLSIRTVRRRINTHPAGGSHPGGVATPTTSPTHGPK